MPRAFVAVLLSEPVRKAISAQIDRLRPLSKVVTWVPSNNLHVTLRFLGDQTEQELAKVMLALEEAASGVPAFTLGLRGMGAFPNLEHPRTLWVGISDGAPDVKSVQSCVAEALARRDIPIETRVWQAHVTIGRIPDEKRWRREGIAEIRSGLIRGAAMVFGSTPVTSIALMRSDLFPSGARYTDIGTVPLSSG